MAIALEFIDFVVPIATIREFRGGAMSPGDVREIAERWRRLGFGEGRRDILERRLRDRELSRRSDTPL